MISFDMGFVDGVDFGAAAAWLSRMYPGRVLFFRRTHFVALTRRFPSLKPLILLMVKLSVKKNEKVGFVKGFEFWVYFLFLFR